jgi:hypothetical protein
MLGTGLNLGHSPYTAHVSNQALIDAAYVLGLWPRLRPVPNNRSIIEVSTTLRTTEKEMTPSHLSPPPGLRLDQYLFIRLFKIEDKNILETLDSKIGTVNEVPNIEELSDGL